MNKVLLPIILLLAMTSPAKAELNCGALADDYLEVVKQESGLPFDQLAWGFVHGYAKGFVDGDWSRDYAVPSSASVNQVVRVVGKWLRNNPDLWHLSANKCVHRALIETWPKK